MPPTGLLRPLVYGGVPSVFSNLLPLMFTRLS
jgi:hypothetical protein